jgi:hypothetical protein
MILHGGDRSRKPHLGGEQRTERPNAIRHFPYIMMKERRFRSD